MDPSGTIMKLFLHEIFLLCNRWQTFHFVTCIQQTIVEKNLCSNALLVPNRHSNRAFHLGKGAKKSKDSNSHAVIYFSRSIVESPHVINQHLM